MISLKLSRTTRRQQLTPEQVFHALKDLEKEAEGELKEKIRALMKEVDRREGISRKKWIGIHFLEVEKKRSLSTWVSFAKSWVEDKSLADSAFKTFKSLNYLSLSNNKQLLASALNAYDTKANEFVNFADSNGFDGVNFLKELPALKDIYRDALPLYSINSSLVKAV
ncbi:MAG: hypothetical protein QW830_05750 [Nitrososphaerales archaeon]